MAAKYLYMDFLRGYKEHFDETEECTEEEVMKIEEQLGVKFPRSYREIYLILGEQEAFSLIDESSFEFPEYEKMRKGVEKIILNSAPDFTLDKNMFIVGCLIQNGIFYFFKLDEGDDPPIYRYQEGDKKYKMAAESCSSFIQQQSWYKGYLVLREYKRSGKS